MTDNLLAAAKTALEEVQHILEGFKSFMMVLGIDSWHYFPGCPAFEARIEAIRAAIKAAEAKLVAAKPKTHLLKTSPEPFEAILNGTKTFEYRRNDRDYSIGDTLILAEYIAGRLTPRKVRAQITYILRGPCFEVLDGYVILSLKLSGAKPEPFYEPPAAVDAEEVRLLKELERIVRTNSPRATASALEALDAHRRAAGKEGT